MSPLDALWQALRLAFTLVVLGVALPLLFVVLLACVVGMRLLLALGLRLAGLRLSSVWFWVADRWHRWR